MAANTYPAKNVLFSLNIFPCLVFFRDVYANFIEEVLGDGRQIELHNGEEVGVCGLGED